MFYALILRLPRAGKAPQHHMPQLPLAHRGLGSRQDSARELGSCLGWGIMSRFL